MTTRLQQGLLNLRVARVRLLGADPLWLPGARKALGELFTALEVMIGDERVRRAEVDEDEPTAPRARVVSGGSENAPTVLQSIRRGSRDG